MNAPAMISDAGGRRRGACVPAVAGLVGTSAPAEAQTVVAGAKIVDRANQVHALFQSRHLASQGAAATDQVTQARPEGGIQALDIGCVDSSAALRASTEALPGTPSPLDDPERDGP